MHRYDVVVIGGGIAGSALAAALAPAGLDVLVLERVTEFRDKVRGEYMQPWGAVEMLQMGLDDVLLAAGGGWCRRIIPYGEGTDPAAAESNAIPLDAMIPGIPGSFNVGHPQASEALNTAAATRGATVLRDVTDVEVSVGSEPSVRYSHDGKVHDVECRLIVGADGRQSTVRKELGIALHKVESPAVLGGLLVRAETWPVDSAIIGVEGERHFLAFPRPNGYVRLYLCRLPSPETSGADRARHMLDAYRLDCVPGSDVLASATPAGPCSYVLGSDSWTDVLAVDGAVLIGDAAGWNDPILGCGLSVAMRDARSVADVLLAGDDWSPAAFESYAAERGERMSRLRISARVATELNCDSTPEGRDRRRAVRELMASDPLVVALRASPLMGPESAPAEAFTEETIGRALAFA